jgi:signal peptidase I
VPGAKKDRHELGQHHGPGYGASSRQRRRRGVWLLLRDVFVIVLIAVVVSFVIKTFLVRSFYIPSGSMEQTLLIKDRILVDELTPRFGGYQRGDVVVFRDPGGWLPPAPATPRSRPWPGRRLAALARRHHRLGQR